MIERFIRSLKDECTRRIFVPLRLDAMREEIRLYVDWHNRFRASQGLGGRTPDEVYYDRPPANEKPRYEPRRKWPRDALCAAPWAQVKGRRLPVRVRTQTGGVRLKVKVTFLEGRKHLPIVGLKPAA